MAPHSSTLDWKIPWAEEPGRQQSMGVSKSWTWLNDFTSLTSYITGEGNGNPYQYSCLENPMDRGAWWAMVCRVTESRTWLKWLSTHAALLTMPKALTAWVTGKCGKFGKRWEYQTTWPAPWEICMQVRKQQLKSDMEQQTGSKEEKEYIKAVYSTLLI